MAFVDGQVLVKPGYGKNVASVKNHEVLKSFTKYSKPNSYSSVTSDYNSEVNLSIHENESTPKRKMKTSKSNTSIIDELNYNTSRHKALYGN